MKRLPLFLLLAACGHKPIAKAPGPTSPPPEADTCRDAPPLLARHQKNVADALAPNLSLGARAHRWARVVELQRELSNLADRAGGAAASAQDLHRYSERARELSELAKTTQKELLEWGVALSDLGDVGAPERALRAYCEKRSGEPCDSVKKTLGSPTQKGDLEHLQHCVDTLARVESRDRTFEHLLHTWSSGAKEVLSELERGTARIRPLADKASAMTEGFGSLEQSLKSHCREEPKAPRKPRPSPEFLGNATPDLRKLTVLVETRVPTALDHHITEWMGAPHDGERKTSSFGSGFVLVRPSGTYVITNRHVVEFAEAVSLRSSDGDPLPSPELLYIDATFDLAVLRYKGPSPFREGLAVDETPPSDRDPVVATGFPALGRRASYQTTRGFVSNDRFIDDESGRAHLQHTAPIDSGSSGGPLTSESGYLVGVNTFKARGRENAAFAIPVSGILHALREAERPRSVESLRGQATAACRAFLSDYSPDAAEGAERSVRVSNRLLVARGTDDAEAFVEEKPMLRFFIAGNPLQGFQRAAEARIRRVVSGAHGFSAKETCTRGHEADFQAIASTDRVRFTLAMRSGISALLTLAPAHGHYELVDFELED